MAWNYNDRCPSEEGDYMLPPIMPPRLVFLMFLVVAGGLIVTCGVGLWSFFCFHP